MPTTEPHEAHRRKWWQRRFPARFEDSCVNEKEHDMRRLFFSPRTLFHASLLLSIAVAVIAASARASFPGEPGRIAFMSDRSGNWDIYTVKPNGKDTVQLTDDPAADQFPSWSADRSKIVFTSTRDGNAEIYVMNADGSEQTRLTFDTSFDENPVFSPDGSKIAFASTRDAPPGFCPGTGFPLACVPYTEIYVMDADGTKIVRLTTNSALDRFPMFSPDGSKIAFTSNRDSNTEIYVMNTDGSDQTRITYRPGGDSQPSWSPDGIQIAWRSTPPEHPDTGGDIWVMTADGSDAAQLTTDPADDLRPAWSPSGAKIAFRSLRTNRGDIFIMKADGSKQEQLTDDPAQDAYPDWQPVASEEGD